jgi:hypothetical protein
VEQMSLAPDRRAIEEFVAAILDLSLHDRVHHIIVGRPPQSLDIGAGAAPANSS